MLSTQTLLTTSIFLLTAAAKAQYGASAGAASPQVASALSVLNAAGYTCAAPSTPAVFATPAPSTSTGTLPPGTSTATLTGTDTIHVTSSLAFPTSSAVANQGTPAASSSAVPIYTASSSAAAVASYTPQTYSSAVAATAPVYSTAAGAATPTPSPQYTGAAAPHNVAKGLAVGMAGVAAAFVL